MAAPGRSAPSIQSYRIGVLALSSRSRGQVVLCPQGPLEVAHADKDMGKHVSSSYDSDGGGRSKVSAHFTGSQFASPAVDLRPKLVAVVVT